jgi:hypothetical protein
MKMMAKSIAHYIPRASQMFDELILMRITVDFSDFDPPHGFKGSLYPIRNGLIQAADIDENLLTTYVICIEGEKICLKQLKNLKQVKVIHRHPACYVR